MNNKKEICENLSIYTLFSILYTFNSKQLTEKENIL